MMTQTLPAIALAALITLGAQTADARGEGHAALPSFDQLDPAGTGAITLADLQTYLQAQRAGRQDQVIAKLMEQAGPDGKLDEAALRQGLEALRAERMAELGQSRRHGGPDQAEMGARMFARMDANDDGKVDAEEYGAFASRMAEHRGEGRRGEHRRGWHD